jgi:hypothetical protein
MAELLHDLDALHRQMDALRLHFRERAMEMTWQLGGMNQGVPDTFEQFYGGLDDARDDRAEIADLDQFHERLDAMQQAREQERGHERGIEV